MKRASACRAGGGAEWSPRPRPREPRRASGIRNRHRLRFERLSRRLFVGFQRGRRDGAEEGRSDGRHRREFEFWREGDYRKGTPGYKGWMGPKWEYADGYRRGFETGYRRSFAAARRGYRGYYGDGRYGYDGRGRYDGHGQYDHRERYDDPYRDWDR